MSHANNDSQLSLTGGLVGGNGTPRGAPSRVHQQTSTQSQRMEAPSTVCVLQAESVPRSLTATDRLHLPLITSWLLPHNYVMFYPTIPIHVSCLSCSTCPLDPHATRPNGTYTPVHIRWCVLVKPFVIALTTSLNQEPGMNQVPNINLPFSSRVQINALVAVFKTYEPSVNKKQPCAQPRPSFLRNPAADHTKLPAEPWILYWLPLISGSRCSPRISNGITVAEM